MISSHLTYPNFILPSNDELQLNNFIGHKIKIVNLVIGRKMYTKLTKNAKNSIESYYN